MLSWLGSKDVNQLIARRQYGKAAKELERQLAKDPKSVHLRKLLADVLVRDGRKQQAIKILEGLVNEYAEEGFLTKAIAVLKKVQRIDPDASGANDMLDRLLAMKSKSSPEAAPPEPVAPAEAAPEAPAPPQKRDVPPRGRPQPPPGMDAFKTSQVLLSDVWFDEAAEREDFNWSPLFRDFSKSELAALIGGLRLLVKKPGSIVFSEGEPGDSLFVLANGVARVYGRDTRGHNNQVAVLKEGEIFGIPSVLGGEARTATVTVMEECELLELDRAIFEDITETFPRIREQVEKLHADRTV